LEKGGGFDDFKAPESLSTTPLPISARQIQAEDVANVDLLTLCSSAGWQ
jgi:hypothetical protein